MRHQLKGRKLNRTKSHRKALFANMATSLFQFEKIKTTLPKAKELRVVAEKLITVGKKGSLHAHRQLIASLKSEDVARKVLNDLSKRYTNRHGGYTRIIKAGFRYGDAAPMAIIELVDRPEDVSAEQPVKEKAAQKAKPAKTEDAAA